MLASAAPAYAETPPVWIWYRTSDGCPDGPAFVSRLSELGKTARLAKVGDRVDFVVTLGAGVGNEESSGRLERQTRGGTVAIREYRDLRCEQVAEALALTLDLAIDPEASARSGAAVENTLASPNEASSSNDLAVARAPVDRNPEAPGALAIGVLATLASGVAPGALPGAGLFVELAPALAVLPALRATLLGGYGQSQAEQREVEVTLLAARLEACPLEWRWSGVVLRPCVGADAGLLQAQGGEPLGASDSGFWSAAVGLGRVSFQLGSQLALELAAGARVPLLRYEMGTRDGSAAWFQTRDVGLDTSLGAAWSFR
jgi:hypothetical protein